MIYPDITGAGDLFAAGFLFGIVCNFGYEAASRQPPRRTRRRRSGPAHQRRRTFMFLYKAPVGRRLSGFAGEVCKRSLEMVVLDG